MNYERIKFSKLYNIGSIVLNSPQRLNSVDLLMLQEMLDALNQCERDDEIRVVVISGEGSSFCAGADLQSLLGEGWEQVPYLIRDMARTAGDVALKIRNIPKPVISCLKGAAAGAGFNIALVSDFRIAADNCKFIQAFVNVGLIPDTGGMFVLSRLLGAGKATELAMTGKTICSKEANSMGLLTKMVPLDELERETLEYAQKLSQAPSHALRMMKILINRTQFMGFENYLENEVEYQFESARTNDFKEGVQAFLEKRKPRFNSR